MNFDWGYDEKLLSLENKIKSICLKVSDISNRIMLKNFTKLIWSIGCDRMNDLSFSLVLERVLINVRIRIMNQIKGPSEGDSRFSGKSK